MNDSVDLQPRWRRLAQLSGAAVLALAVAACGANADKSSSGSGASGGSGPIKIGVTLPLTGPVATVGVQELAGMRLAVETINAGGGIGGRPLKLVELDDKFTPDQAVLNVRKLVQQEEVFALVGPGSSNAVVPAGQTAQQLQVPMIGLPTTFGDVWEGNGTLKWAYGTAGPGASMGAGCINSFLQAQKDKGSEIKKIAIGLEENAGPIAYVDGVKQVAKERGIEVVENQKWAGDVTDLTTQVGALLKNKPDAVVLATQLPSNVLSMKALDQLGALGKTPVANCSIVDIAAWTKGVGAAANKDGLYLMAQAFDLYVRGLKTGADNDAARQKIIDAYAKYKNAAGVDYISNFTASGWDAVHLMASAIEKGGADRAGVQKALEELQPYVGAVATVHYGPKQHRATFEDFSKSVILVKFTGGEPQLAVKGA